MCNIWKRSSEIPDLQKRELSRDEIINLFSHPLFSDLVELDLTGGEPHLRQDLVEIVAGIAELKRSNLRRLKSIIITSNGLLPDRIVANYKNILGEICDSEIDLVSVSSLDGFAETHDAIRGTPGAFRQVTRTLEGLLKLQRTRPRFFVGLKMTVLPGNIDSLDAMLDFAETKTIFHIISPVFFTQARFRNSDREDNLALGPAEFQKIAQFYNHPELKFAYFYTRTREQLISGKRAGTALRVIITFSSNLTARSIPAK